MESQVNGVQAVNASSFAESYQYENLTSGSAGVWRSCPKKSLPAWLNFDLGTKVALEKLRIISTSRKLAPKEICVEYFDSNYKLRKGEEETLIFDASLPNYKRFQYFTLKAKVEAVRYIRIKILSNWGGESVQVNTILFFGQILECKELRPKEEQASVDEPRRWYVSDRVSYRTDVGKKWYEGRVIHVNCSDDNISYLIRDDSGWVKDNIKPENVQMPKHRKKPRKLLASCPEILLSPIVEAIEEDEEKPAKYSRCPSESWDSSSWDSSFWDSPHKESPSINFSFVGKHASLSFSSSSKDLGKKLFDEILPMVKDLSVGEEVREKGDCLAQEEPYKTKKAVERADVNFNLYPQGPQKHSTQVPSYKLSTQKLQNLKVKIPTSSHLTIKSNSPLEGGMINHRKSPTLKPHGQKIPKVYEKITSNIYQSSEHRIPTSIETNNQHTVSPPNKSKKIYDKKNPTFLGSSVEARNFKIKRLNQVYNMSQILKDGKPMFKNNNGLALWWYKELKMWMITKENLIGTDQSYAFTRDFASHPAKIVNKWKTYNRVTKGWDYDPGVITSTRENSEEKPHLETSLSAIKTHIRNRSKSVEAVGDIAIWKVVLSGFKLPKLNNVYLLQESLINDRPHFKSSSNIVLWWFHRRRFWMLSPLHLVKCDKSYACIQHAAAHPKDIEGSWQVYDRRLKKFVEDAEASILPGIAERVLLSGFQRAPKVNGVFIETSNFRGNHPRFIKYDKNRDLCLVLFHRSSTKQWCVIKEGKIDAIVSCKESGMHPLDFKDKKVWKDALGNKLHGVVT